MKILLITHLEKETSQINDYMTDIILHGLRKVYGADVIEFPGVWYMYKDEVKKRNFDYAKLWGNGFTFYDSLTSYNSIDRNDIESKIKNNYFDYIIYTSITKSKLYLDLSINSKSKLILIDGEDNTILNENKNSNILYLKRELKDDFKNVYPINLSIPKEKIINNLNSQPTNLLAPLIPHKYKTYIYKNESDYYNMWQESLFGISYVYGGWWEALRYYEMLMNGCIPLIMRLKDCPEKTLTQIPKEKLLYILNNYSWILNQYFPGKIYKKKFLSLDKFTSYFMQLFKKNYNSKSFIEEFPEINNIRNELMIHTKKYLTTEFTANYVINVAEKFYK